jgi:wyosine [tRNA(Phe)-imidazoG37] synthetase (radical SAM superfamily)
MIAFGPVPSRRLGQSLGINNIPPKICTYSCAYCQVGKTTRMQIDRAQFYDPEEIYLAVRKKVKKKRRGKVNRLIILPLCRMGNPPLMPILGRKSTF